MLIPFKCNLEESDLSTEEYNLTGLLNYPVLADAGYLTLRAVPMRRPRRRPRVPRCGCTAAGGGGPPSPRHWA